eukprot:g4680.t1
MRLFLFCVFSFVLVVNGQTRVPTLLWSSNEVFGKRTKTEVSYESVKFTDLWNSVLGNLFRTRSSSTAAFPEVDDTPDLFILFISQKLTWLQLGQNSPAIKPLHDAFDTSDAQFAFTNVMLQEGQHLTDVLSASLDAITDVTYFGSCSQEMNDNLQQAFQMALARAINTKPRVSTKFIVSQHNLQILQAMVICGSGSLENEMQQLKQVMSVVSSYRIPYATFFVSEQQDVSVKQYITPQKRRTLLNSTDKEERLEISYDRCDRLCFTRVKFLEGIVLAFVLALALTAGLCCMNILDAPSQFEKPDEDQ